MKFSKSQILCITQGIFFVISLLGSAFYVRSSFMELGHGLMCQEMNDELFEKPGEDFLEGCAEQFSSFSSYDDWELRMNSWLGSWGWSHFSVYRPSKTKELWESLALDVGAKFKLIDRKWVAMRTHPDSPFRRGDEVLAVNGQRKLTYKLLHQSSGIFIVERNQKSIELEVPLKEYLWEDNITFKSPNIIVVPSFRKEFFYDDESFASLLNSIEEDEIVIDLRNNYGGNMGAGLSFLSYFFCEPVTIGYIERPRSDEGESEFPETLDDSSQMEYLEKYTKLNLKTFKKEQCTNKSLKVVINSNTSSTAELVAQAFVDLERGLLIGQPTSGQLVLSKWNEVPEFPEGFSYSYPVAIYKTIHDVMIEGFGVYPDVIKSYDLTYEKKGIDSFLVN